MSENAKSVFDELMSEIPNSLDKREGAVIHTDRKSTRLNSSHRGSSRMPSSA